MPIQVKYAIGAGKFEAIPLSPVVQDVDTKALRKNVEKVADMNRKVKEDD